MSGASPDPKDGGLIWPPRGMLTLKLTQNLDLVTPAEYLETAKGVLLYGGRYKRPRTALDDRVRRVLDVGAGVGEFCCWAWKRWPRCWIDAIATDDELRRVLYENLPPGGRVLDPGETVELEKYDVIRVADEDYLPLAYQAEQIPTPILIVDVQFRREEPSHTKAVPS